MKKLVMFDMDGVLFDTMPRHAKAWKRTMAELGYDLPEKEFFMHEGRNGRGTIDAIMGPGQDTTAIYKRKCAYFDALEEGGVMPGAMEVVKAVYSLGIPAVVVTGSGQQKTFSRVEKEYPGLFRTQWMVTGNDVTKGKPDPEPYLMGLAKAGVSADEAVVIENAPLGVESAHAAGCYTIAVNTGPLDDKVLLDAGADLLFGSMADLAKEIESILEK